MRRGEVWTYGPPNSPRVRTVVIVSNNGINDTRSWVVGVPIEPSDPVDLLAVPVDGQGWIRAGLVTQLYRPWLTGRAGRLDQDTADQLDVALRAALDL